VVEILRERSLEVDLLTGVRARVRSREDAMVAVENDVEELDLQLGVGREA
jgi:hypothetical protein